MDSAPIIYMLEDHPEFAPIFRPVFEAHSKGHVRFAVTTTTLVEVLTGSLRRNDEIMTERYRSALKSWFMVDLDSEIAESAARLRAVFRLRLADSIQAASALVIGADALVTHDSDFTGIRDIKILGVAGS
jgi:predicted nucleic acid-binding protein